MRAPTSALLTLAAIAAASLLTACATTTTVGPATTANPTVGITTRSVVTSGAGETPSNTIAEVSGWWTGGGNAHITTLSNDFTKLGADSSSDPNTVGTDCNTISGHISAAQTYRPIPDAQAQQHWSAALDQFQQAATDCLAGVATTNADLINKASTEIKAGITELGAATDRIKQIAAGG